MFRAGLLLLIAGTWLGAQTVAPAPARRLDAGYFQFVVPGRPAAAYRIAMAAEARTFSAEMLALYPRHDRDLPAHRLRLVAGTRVVPLAAWAPFEQLPATGTMVSPEHLWLEIHASGWTGWVQGADAFRQLGFPATGDPPAPAPAGVVPDDCYSFADARLWLACGRGLQPVSLGAVGAYALNPDGTAIALPRAGGIVIVAVTARPYLLGQGTATAAVSTCGTLVAEPGYDLLARQPLQPREPLPVYCDRKRHLMATFRQGTTTATRGGKTAILSRDATAPPVVSGNGKFIVWSEPRRFCALAVGRGVGCLPLPARLRPRAVNAIGATLFDGAGIWYWRPGLAAPVRLEPGGENPQWVSPEAAERLRLWYHVQQPQWPYLARPLN
jgi:hypothetical protein